MSTIPSELTRTLADRYRIERELGRGGMATVYLADDLKHGRKVAIKVLHPERAAWIGQERFLREIEIAARLNHPHILALYDSGAAEGHLYYVMPYIAGGSLRARLQREKQLPIEDALRITREIASALGHAHQEGLVHRDIKPENVLISDGIALVADFGIARALSSGGALTTAGGAIGTPAYMAPEQAMGSATVDGRADLYALACVLYEMLAGQPPFTGPDEGLIRQHLSVEPRPVTDLRPTVSQQLSAAIARGLAKLPSDRFATAARFAEALSSSVSSTPTPTPAPEGRTTPHNLPRQRTHFIGRERELAECARALGDTRVLTITGIGGCGKTRLGLRLAESVLESFPDGVWYADLAPLKDADRVPLALSTALDVREEVGTPLLDKVKRFVEEKPRTLIVLDNCEHVLTAVTELVDLLIAWSGDLKVIVTSREGLGIEGERLFALRSLSVPTATSATDPRSLESTESVRLFVDRAQIVDSRFTLTEQNAPAVAEICRRLDGIPLAIELAAARSKVLKVEDIAARLDDRFRLLTGGSKTAMPRHQTLRAAIQWSYEQLTPDEQQLFRLLSVFSGGWTLEAATYVSGENADEFEVLELMTRLVDKSLVTMDREAAGESRYSMLETVRQFAQDLLSEAGEGDGARTRHLGFYVALAEKAEPFLRAREQKQWGARLLQELENLLSAHAWCDRSPSDAERGLRLVGALRRFWTYTALFDLGRGVTLEALARPGAGHRTAARAKALSTASNLAFLQGKYTEGTALGEEALGIARDLRDPERIREALQFSAQSYSGQRDLSKARAYAQQLVDHVKQMDDNSQLGSALTSLAEVIRMDGDLEGAEPLYEGTLRWARERGDRQNESVALINLTSVSLQRGRLDRARTFLAETVSIGEELTARSAAVALNATANWCAVCEEWSRAARMYGAAQAIFAKVGYELEPADKVVRDPLLARTREALTEAAYQAAFAEGMALDQKAALDEARSYLQQG